MDWREVVFTERVPGLIGFQAYCDAGGIEILVALCIVEKGPNILLGNLKIAPLSLDRARAYILVLHFNPDYVLKLLYNPCDTNSS